MRQTGMKGKFTTYEHPEGFAVGLRFAWKHGESHHALEYQVPKDFSSEEIAEELEKFAFELRQINSKPITFQ